MAKASFIMHGARGRVGNVVGYQRAGEKLMRALPTSVRNPQTDEQVLTRLALSSAAKTAQHLRGIVSHSFQGIKYGQDSVNHFTSRLAREIRGAMSAAMAKVAWCHPSGLRPFCLTKLARWLLVPVRSLRRVTFRLCRLSSTMVARAASSLVSLEFGLLFLLALSTLPTMQRQSVYLSPISLLCGWCSG